MALWLHRFLVINLNLGILTKGEGSGDLLIKAACFVKNVNNILNVKRS
jgi:hypothetical protein